MVVKIGRIVRSEGEDVYNDDLLINGESGIDLQTPCPSRRLSSSSGEIDGQSVIDIRTTQGSITVKGKVQETDCVELSP